MSFTPGSYPGEPANAHPTPPSDNDFLLVENIDILIVALIGFIALLRLPRGLARLWKRSEWSEGHFIRSGAVNRQIPLSLNPSATSPIKESSSMEPMSATTSELHFDHSGGLVVNGEEALRPTYPPHIPAYPAFLRPVVEHLRRSFVPWYSNSQVLLMLAYLGILLYACFYRSDFLNNHRRLGIIAASQLPFLYSFAGKNSVPGSFWGVGYQSLNYFHRYVGCLVILAANIHAIGYFYKWTTLNTVSTSFQDLDNKWGLVALTCMDVIFVFSLPVFREKVYNIFRIIHLVGFWVIVPALYLHHSSTRPFIITVSVVYLLDQAFCLLKTRLVIAEIRPLPTLSATRIEIPSLKGGWRAGQHVRIRVLSTSLGWFGWMEPHPFTIASAPSTEGRLVGGQGLLLICKNAGGWTRRLYEMARASQPIESGARYASRAVIVQIEGPYGGPGHAMIASYSAVVMIIGGSGITFALSIIQDLVQKGLRGESRVKVIELRWIVPNPDAMTPLLPLLTSLMNSCSYLTISVHYTRPSTPSMEVKCSNSSLSFTAIQEEQVPTRHRIVKYPGRPGHRDLVSVMENAITRATSGLNDANRTSSRNVPSGMLVGVCGPQGMSEDVVAAVSAIDSKIKARIGGVEMHQEKFGF